MFAWYLGPKLAKVVAQAPGEAALFDSYDECVRYNNQIASNVTLWHTGVFAGMHAAATGSRWGMPFC